MSHGLLSLLPLLTAALAAGGCYRDAAAPPLADAPITVLLADGSAPAIVDRVEVYVTEVAASTTPDTLPERQQWTPIVRPARRYELAALPPGVITVAGEGALPAGVYRAVRVTLNTDSTRVLLADGREARVRWPVPGEYAVHAIVEAPLDAPAAAGLRLGLELDVARSLGTGLDPLFDFVFLPLVRAVDVARTGALTGTVRADGNGDGTGQPLANAVVTVLAADPRYPGEVGRVVATARSDALGQYRVGLLLNGSYTVRVDGPPLLSLVAVTVPDILIVAGAESRLDVTLTGPRLRVAEPVIPPIPLPVTRRL